jgi:collagenase-like PrtC family protease
MLGVKYIKLTGRSKPAEWLPEVVNAYLQRNYEGNLVRLMGIDPCAYCDTWMIRLNQEGAFWISDGSEYSPEGDSLALRFAGEQVNHIISKERER